MRSDLGHLKAVHSSQFTVLGLCAHLCAEFGVRGARKGIAARVHMNTAKSEILVSNNT